MPGMPNWRTKGCCTIDIGRQQGGSILAAEDPRAAPYGPSFRRSAGSAGSGAGNYARSRGWVSSECRGSARPAHQQVADTKRLRILSKQACVSAIM